MRTTVDSLSYVLIKAEEGPARSQPAPVGTAGAGAEQGFGKSYRLDVDTDTMNPHVGHRVEIVGSVISAAPLGAVGATGQVPAGADVPAETPILRVESVKMISSTCGR